MFKRLALVFLLTGLGHVISIFALKFASENLDSKLFVNIAEIDTHLQLILSLIALGLQSKSIRDIAISENWKNDFEKTQSARVTLSLIIIFISVFAIQDTIFLIYLITPLLALNGDYALYAKGYPIMGALSAFLRTSIPLITVTITSIFYKEMADILYLISLIIIYFITNIIISNYLKVKFFFIPKLKYLKLYTQSLNMGIITLGYYFLGIGILIIADFFYYKNEISQAFIILKLYVIYKGVLRIIQQSFINEMKLNSNCLKIDKLSINCGIIFISAIIAFPVTFVNLFFGNKLVNHQLAIIIIGVSALINSIFTSMTTKALLDKKEKILIVNIIFSVIISIITLISLSFYHKTVDNIAYSILVGEIVFSFLNAKSFLTKNELFNRLKYLITASFGLIGCYLFSLYTIDSTANFLMCISLLSVMLFSFSLDSFKIAKVE